MTTLLGELESKATSINKKNLVIQDFDTKCPNRNIFVVGGPGSYKSAGYVIPNVKKHLILNACKVLMLE